jgi:hypothetical protein
VPDVPRVTLVGDREQVNPVVGETLSVRATVPAKLSMDVTVIVDVPATFARAVTVVGLAVILKSSML